MDKSGANRAPIEIIIVGKKNSTVVRQVRYRNSIVDQDHRTVNRVTVPMFFFQSFQSVKCVLASIGLMHMIRIGLLMMEGCNDMSFAEKFYALSGQVRPS